MFNTIIHDQMSLIAKNYMAIATSILECAFIGLFSGVKKMSSLLWSFPSQAQTENLENKQHLNANNNN